MLVDIYLQPYCEDCPLIELETHGLRCDDRIIITHVCTHRQFCENAINQNKKFWDKRKEESE